MNGDKNKAYKDCMKAETRKCEDEGRAHFNDNFCPALLYGPAMGGAVKGGYELGKKAGWWATTKTVVESVVSKAGPYVAVVSGALSIRRLAREGVAIENACKKNLDELCKRRAGLL